MDFYNLTNNQIKNWLIKNKVCIVTNSTMLPGTLYIASLKTYIDYIPQNNYLSIPGRVNNQHFYGFQAFIQMINTLIESHRFDYALYIDEDCFIKDFPALLSEFEKFMNGNYCVAGIQDGGSLCHRNHSHLLVNTFVSFWNLKCIKGNLDINRLIESSEPYQLFRNELNKELLDTMTEYADSISEKMKQYREDNYHCEVPYCSIVRDDPSNPSERYQIPYSYKEDALKNFEPYYYLEEALVLATNLPIYYIASTDFYNPDGTELDNTGLTSIVLTSEDYKPIAYHTWFSRAYNNFGKSEVELFHTQRINKIIKNL